MHKKFSIKNCIKAFIESLLLFIKQLYVFAFFYGYVLLGALGISLVIPIGLHYLGLSHDACDTVFRILLTVTPVFPTAYYSYLASEDMNDEFNSSLGFAMWIIVVIYAWVIH